MLEAHNRVIHAMEGFVEQELGWLRPVPEVWQPSDFLPDFALERWPEALQALRTAAAGLSDDVLIVLVGDTVTEEALPAYQTMINRHAGMADATGASDSPWARWTRGWTAEENRHGDVLNKYLFLSGRVQMRAVELTTQHLIRNGFDPQTGNDPYKGLIYTSFQERATRVSHGNVAQVAQKSGDALLSKLCNLVAGDEARHEEAYKRFVGKLMELDPSGTVIAFAQMMKAKITMPARLMGGPGEDDLFQRFSVVAQRLGVYTAQDYVQILQHLLGFWGVPRLTGLLPEARKAQEYLCGLPAQYQRFAERLKGQRLLPAAPWQWLFGRSA